MRGRLAMVVPPWTKELFSGSLEDVVQRVKTVVGNSQLSTTALKGLDVVLQETQRGAQQLRRWARRFSSLSFSAINASDTFFHEQLQGCPLATEQLNQMFPGEYFSTRQDGLDRERIEQLACGAIDSHLKTSCLIARSTESALIAAVASLPPGTLIALWRGSAIRFDGNRTVPEILGSLGHKVLEVGTSDQLRDDDWDPVRRWEEGPVVLVDLRRPAASFSPSSAPPTITETAGRHPVHTLCFAPLGSPRGLAGVPTQWTVPLTRETLEKPWLTIVPGDRMVGGPRSGILLGVPATLARLRNTPLWPVLQADLGTIAGLTYTLQQTSPAPFGLEKLIATSLENLQDRSERLAIQLAGDPAIESSEVIQTTVRIARELPREIPSRAVRLKHRHLTPEAWAEKLAGETPALLVNFDSSALLLDMRWLPAPLDERIAAVIGKFSSPESPPA